MEKKIIFILPFSSKSGSSFRGIQLSQAYNNKLIIAPRTDKFGNKTMEKEIIKINRKFFGLSMIIPLIKIFKKENPSIIVYTKPTIFSVFSCLIYKLINKDIKVIADYDEYEPATSQSNNVGLSKIIKPIMHFFMHKISNLISDGFIISNKNIIKHIPKRKLFVYLPNAADPQKILPAKSQSHKKFSIFYFGNIRRTDQIVNLLNITKEIKEYQFVFVGKLFDKKLKKEFPNVKFLGEYSLSEMSKIASYADILIAFFEPTSGNKYTSNMKIFDYMCLQKPIIVSDTGELKEYIHYPKGGYVVKSGNKEELKRTIEWIKTHYKEAMQKAKYARKLAESVESWESRRKKFKQFIKKLQR